MTTEPNPADVLAEAAAVAWKTMGNTHNGRADWAERYGARLIAAYQQAQPTPDAMAALENPTLEMCRAAIVAWDNNAVESDEAGMKAALTAAAAHLKGQTNDRT